MILKHYANLPAGQTHYRRGGSGQPLVALHPSPMSSALMLPIISGLMDVADVIAPDTPGYGQSDPLPAKMLESSDDLSPYVEWLLQFIDSLGLAKIALYGSATGAQIAIEFARAHPQRVEFAVVDNAAHFSSEARDQMLPKYFPDLSPKADGSHLQDVWNISRSLFQWFPWHAQDQEHMVSETEPPTLAVHATTMAYLTAGVDYAQAYKRAFMNEDATRLQALTVPTHVIRWDGSIVKKYTDRFDDFAWPENIQMCHCSGGVEERYSAIKKSVVKLSGDSNTA